MSRLGARYSLLDFNCEHLAELAFGRTVTSKQVRTAVSFGGLALLLLVAGGAAASVIGGDDDPPRDALGRAKPKKRRRR